MRIKNKIRLVYIMMIGLVIWWPATYASINDDLQTYMNDVGYSSNTTSPHAVQGQEAGYYSGGSLFVRTPVRNLQLAQIQLPSLHAGCGGIDLFNGGISFVNSDELASFGKKVLTESPTVALQIAMETYTPQLSKVMNTVQEWAQQVNSFNMSSCEAATDLVAGAWPKNSAATRYLCQDIGTQSNQFADWLSAKEKCNNQDEQDQAFKTGNKDPRYKNQLPINKNIVWSALKNNGFLQNDQALAEFFMTISGTIIFDKNQVPTVKESHAQDKALLTALLDGGQATIYHCDEPDQCLNITEQTITITQDAALKQKVLSILLALQSQFQSDQPLTAEEKGFLEYTSYPILKFISLEYESGRTPDMAMFADAISEDLLSQYLINIMNSIRDTISISTSYNEDVTKKIYQNIDSGLAYLNAIQARANQQIVAMTQVTENYMQIEKRVVGDFSAKTQDNYSFGD